MKFLNERKKTDNKKYYGDIADLDYIDESIEILPSHFLPRITEINSNPLLFDYVSKVVYYLDKVANCSPYLYADNGDILIKVLFIEGKYTVYLPCGELFKKVNKRYYESFFAAEDVEDWKLILGEYFTESGNYLEINGNLIEFVLISDEINWHILYSDESSKELYFVPIISKQLLVSGIPQAVMYTTGLFVQPMMTIKSNNLKLSVNDTIYIWN